MSDTQLHRTKPSSTSWLTWSLILICLPFALLVIVMSLIETPAATCGLLFAGIYVLAFTLPLRLSPMWPRAGWRWYLASLLWGSSAALVLVLASGSGWSTITDKLGWESLEASFAGAYPEEIAKSVGVLLILFTSSRCTRPWHGFVTGALVGLGFEVFENITYGAMGALLHPNSDAQGMLNSWLLRSIAGLGLHVFLTALAGYGLGLAVFMHGWDRVQRLQAIFAGLGSAFLLHFLWNVMWATELIQIAVMIIVGLVLYIATAVVWVRCHRAARRDLPLVVTKPPLRSIDDLPLAHGGTIPGL